MGDEKLTKRAHSNRNDFKPIAGTTSEVGFSNQHDAAPSSVAPLPLRVIPSGVDSNVAVAPAQGSKEDFTGPPPSDRGDVTSIAETRSDWGFKEYPRDAIPQPVIPCARADTPFGSFIRPMVPAPGHPQEWRPVPQHQM